ncbi:MAG: hypothetical protein M3280_01260 [Actinomycetota bacterium]|nr:hypothetical protein [Actinomycetota bacterium]
MAGTNLSKLEEELLRVPGVRSARVVGGDVPSEIHIVTTSKRSPKQVVRDVQSLAAAGFGMPIDHRIVSVVQLDEPPAPPPPPERQVDLTDALQGPRTNGHRLVLERVVLASKGDSGWVKVALRWPDGRTTEGAGSAGSTRDARARGASTALLQALGPILEAKQAKVDVDHLLIHRVGSSDSVLVRAVFYERGSVTPLVGSALVYDDVATAAVRAILQAINRKLRLS